MNVDEILPSDFNPVIYNQNVTDEVSVANEILPK